MKIGILSDTHDRLPTFKSAIALFRRLPVDAIIHAGDFVAPFAAKLIAPDALGPIPLYCVYGNNDGEKTGLKKILPNVADGPLRLNLSGKNIVVHHFLDWLKPPDVQPAHVVITGHTHQPLIETRDGKLFINPGECCGWVTGRCTAALLDLPSLKADLIDIHS